MIKLNQSITHSFDESSINHESHIGRVWYASWSHNGKLLATCGEDKKVKIWRLNQKGDLFQLSFLATLDNNQHNRTIRCVEWNPNDQVLAASSFDGTVSIWSRKVSSVGNDDEEENNDDEVNMETDLDEISLDQLQFKCTSVLEGHENEVKSVSWDKSGSLLATCGRDKTVWIWEMLDSENDFDCISVLTGHTQDVKSVKWHPNRDILCSTSYDDTMKTWAEEIDDWHCVDSCNEHTSTVWDLSFNKEGSHCVTCSDDKSLIIWRYCEKNEKDSDFVVPFDKKLMWKKIIAIPDAQKRVIFSTCWKKDSDVIACVGGDNSLKVFSVDIERATKAFKNKESTSSSDGSVYKVESNLENAHKNDINCVRWNPVFTNVMVTVSDDASIKLWTFEENKKN